MAATPLPDPRDLDFESKIDEYVAAMPKLVKELKDRKKAARKAAPFRKARRGEKRQRRED